jgi:hypothetical protein
MGWPNNYVQGVYNSDNELVGIDDGAGGDITFDKIHYCRCPMIYAGSFVMGNNGSFTTTALNRTYATSYMYFPADAIGAGVPAGWYYAEFSSATAGIVYNNVYTLGNVNAAQSKTAFVTTGPGAGSNALSTSVAGFNFNMPGGSLGNNGKITFEGLAIANNSASVKNIFVNFDAVITAQYGLTGFVWYAFSTPLRNMGSQTEQSSPRQNTGGSSIGGSTTSTINMFWYNDLSADRNVNVTHNIASASDYLILAAFDATIERIE